MAITDVVNRSFSRWMEGTGTFPDIVISSRIRLARNLAGTAFPHLLSEAALKEVTDKVKEAVNSRNTKKATGNAEFVPLTELSALDRLILVEKHLMSPQHAQNRPEGRAVAVSEDESVSIMVNEEDHLRIQCLLPGLQLEEALRVAAGVDDALEEKLDFAFSEQYGYLTSCPTNVGTGLRASVMVHLPGLVLANQAGRVLSALSQVGMAIRGLYGEGTEATGNLFQISNQITLGQTEEEIIGNLNVVVKQIIGQEREARKLLMQKMKPQIEDRTCRAYGLMSQARIISSQEAMTHLSDIRLGVDLGIIKGIDNRVFNELLVLTRPAYLQKLAGKEMSAFERDIKRADVIRERIGGH